MSGMKAPSLWIVSVPGKRRQHEVMALTIEQAVGLVAGALGRSVRLQARYLGEAGEVWRVLAVNGVIVAPMIYEDAAAS